VNPSKHNPQREHLGAPGSIRKRGLNGAPNSSPVVTVTTATVSTANNLNGNQQKRQSVPGSGSSGAAETMLHQPTIEKLLAMHLDAMVETWRGFEQDENAQQLSFEKRLSLMVQRLWTWRQNFALERQLR
jgi:hypothetical protein